MTRGNSSVYPSGGSSTLHNLTESLRSRSAEFSAGTQHEGQTDWTDQTQREDALDAEQRYWDRYDEWNKG